MSLAYDKYTFNRIHTRAGIYEYDCTLRVMATSDIAVYLDNVLLTEGTNYSVIIDKQEGGFITASTIKINSVLTTGSELIFQKSIAPKMQLIADDDVEKSAEGAYRNFLEYLYRHTDQLKGYAGKKITQYYTFAIGAAGTAVIFNDGNITITLYGASSYFRVQHANSDLGTIRYTVREAPSDFDTTEWVQLLPSAYKQYTLNLAPTPMQVFHFEISYASAAGPLKESTIKTSSVRIWYGNSLYLYCVGETR